MQCEIVKQNQRNHFESEEYTVQVDINPNKMQQAMANIKALFPDNIECSLGFRNYTKMETFQRLLQIQTAKEKLIHSDYNFRQITGNLSAQILRQKQRKTRQIQKNLKKYHFVLRNPGQINVFFKVYQQKIIQLQNQYNCLLIPKKRSICVCVREEKLSGMLSQSIINMIYEEKTFTTYKKNLVYKLNFSEKCREIIKKEEIDYEVFFPQNILTLHSHKISFSQIMKIVQQKLSFHVSFIIFLSRKIDYYLSLELVKLIAAQSFPIIQYIKQKFQIQVQTNPHQLCFILHDFNPTFSKEPSQLLFQNMTNFRLFHIEGDMMRSVDNYLNKSKRTFQFAKWTYKYRKMFILVDTTQIKSEQQIYQLLKIFITDINERSMIVIYMHPTYFIPEQREAEMQRIISLAQKYNLYIGNFTNLMSNSYEAKLILHFKSFSQAVKIQRQNRIFNFFRQYLASGPIYFPQELYKLAQNSCTSEIIITNKICHKVHQINQDASFSIIKSGDQYFVMKDSQNLTLDLSCVQFNFPEQKQLSIIQYFSKSERDKFTKNIEDQLYQSINIHFKIYKISIDKSVLIKKPNVGEQFQIKFVETAFKQGQIIRYSETNELCLRKIQIGKKGYIVFVSKQDKSIIPSYFFQRI